MIRNIAHDDEDEKHKVIIKHYIEIDEDSTKSPLIIINGKESTEKSLKKINKHKIKTIHVQKGKSAKEKHGVKGKDGVIYVTTKETKHSNHPDFILSDKHFISRDSDKKPLIFIDGKKSTQEDLDKLDKNKIETIQVFKGNKISEKHGEKGKNGVVEITTKKE